MAGPVAPKSATDKIFDPIENLLTERWYWIFILGGVYLIWRYDAWKGLLAVVGTIVLGWLAWKLWVHYIQQDFISGIDYVLLEIVPPRDVERSPKAMELFMTNALYHWSMKGGKEEYWQGAVWFWFSLEIASIDGQVHFYVRTPTRIRSLIETQLYAQYPQAQVKAVEDYTLAVDEITPESDWNAWGCEWKLLKPEAYPIKTYVNFGLDKDPHEEFKVDPISPVIEFFGSLKKGEQAWLQIVVTPSKKEYPVPGSFFKKWSWVENAKNELEKLAEPYTQFFDTGKAVRLPPYYNNVVTVMAAKTGKIGFDVGIRTMYVAKKEIFHPGVRTNASRDIRLIFRQYAMPDCNGIIRYNPTQGDAYGGIITIGAKTVMMLANRMLLQYRERAFFHLPLRHQLFTTHTMHWPLSLLFHAYHHPETFVLNTEELATLWHFPGQILKVPTLERIESKEASPPPNLPT
ncbi:MAG: hypothetical protein WCT29_01605 [Candidatus Paceibacterota bacterium]|jgi:hypothetical protein